MKQFNLDEYLENPSKKVVTREGFPATIVTTIYSQPGYPVIAELSCSFKNKKQSYAFTADGHYILSSEDPRDLFFAPEKHEGWINIFKRFPNKDYLYNCSRTKSQVFKSKESAEKEGKDCLGYITTIKIEWEE